MRHEKPTKSFDFLPIGFARTPFVDKVTAPRQAVVGRDVEGRIELAPDRDLLDAIDGLAAWERIWLIFVFDRAGGYRPKVQPPRSPTRRGVLATRSPHRPNPIGLSVVRLVRVEGLTLHVRDLDLVDGTPILDVKPYVAYADAFPEAAAGWLEAPDPIAPWTVTFADPARRALAMLEDRFGIALGADLSAALALGPEPHAYRRIRRDGDASIIAVREFRARFTVHERTITVQAIASGYRPKEIATRDDLVAHRALTAFR